MNDEKDKPKAPDQQNTREPALPTSGEGSASIVVRLQIQRELASKPQSRESPMGRPGRNQSN